MIQQMRWSSNYMYIKQYCLVICWTTSSGQLFSKRIAAEAILKKNALYIYHYFPRLVGSSHVNITWCLLHLFTSESAFVRIIDKPLVVHQPLGMIHMNST